MAVFLAAYATDPAAQGINLGTLLRGVIAPAGPAHIVQLGRTTVAYSDLHIWPGASVQCADGRMIVVGGDPVICRDELVLARNAAITSLANDLPQGLLDAQGTFAGLCVDQEGQRLRAFTDKVGVRPIYWARSPTHLYIASAFWMLQDLPDLQPTPDWRAAAETAAFGFPLGNRSLRTAISVLEAGHYLEVNNGTLESRHYWDWRNLKPNRLQQNQLLDFVEAEFHAAVDRRSSGQRAVKCYLSGGMDSRLIAVRLRETGKEVHSLNFAPEGSQDLVLGRMIAERINCHHFEYPNGNMGFVERQADALKAWDEINKSLAEAIEFPGLIWSGDGGSVSLGHVYLDKKIIELARSEGNSAAARALQLSNGNFIMPSILRASWKHLADIPLRGIIEDLATRPQLDPGRNCHLFLMLNDQRRHLSKHYETLHIYRTDLILPFFDAKFLSAVLASPIDEFLGHQLYNALMQRLPFEAGKIPWQAYPGHLPCPVPVETGLRHQWDDGWMSAEQERVMRIAHVQRLSSELRNSKGVREVLSIPLLKLLIGAEKLGLSRYGYLLNSCEPFLNAARFLNRRTH